MTGGFRQPLIVTYTTTLLHANEWAMSSGLQGLVLGAHAVAWNRQADAGAVW